MTDLETLMYASAVMGGIIAISAYLGHRSSYLLEKRGDIVNGTYARLLQSPRSKFWHKFFMLGEPSRVIAAYLKKNPAH